MRSAPYLSHRALANFDSFRRVSLPVVIQPPRSHFRRLAAHHADNHVAVPRPCGFAVKLTGPCRMIGMRMIPASDIQTMLAVGRYCTAAILGGNRKTVARRIIAPIYQRK